MIVVKQALQTRGISVSHEIRVEQLVMTVQGHRHERIAEEIRHELSAMLAGELKDPRLVNLMAVTEVRVTPDLKHARVYVTVTGDLREQSKTLQGLTAASGFIRHELTERIQLRRAPEIHFVLDHTEEYGQRIEDLLRQARKSAS
jgi:ribosome-binding factor A